RIYEKRGVPPELARQVAVALTEHDALAAHARDELGLERERARVLRGRGAAGPLGGGSAGLR
ncbi:MAG: VIT1/CCC1 transporter family protein, partial [Solirubrobacteraceae bacterium]